MLFNYIIEYLMFTIIIFAFFYGLHIKFKVLYLGKIFSFIFFLILLSWRVFYFYEGYKKIDYFNKLSVREVTKIKINQCEILSDNKIKVFLDEVKNTKYVYENHPDVFRDNLRIIFITRKYEIKLVFQETNNLGVIIDCFFDDKDFTSSSIDDKDFKQLEKLINEVCPANTRMPTASSSLQLGLINSSSL